MTQPTESSGVSGLPKRYVLPYILLGMAVGVVIASGLFAWKLGSDRTNSGTVGNVKELRLAHGLDQNHPVHAAMLHWAKRLHELSGGKLDLQIFPNGQLGSETDCTEQVQRGALAFVKTSTAALEGFVPEMAVYSMPYLFRDEDHYWQVLEGDIGKELLDAGRNVGVQGVVYYDAGSRSFYTVRKPVLQPSDLKEMKIRVLPSRTLMDMVSIMGGAPPSVPWGELYTALQQGMVDGAENNPPSFDTSRHYEVAKYFSLDEHVRVPDVVLASRIVWDSLSDQERAWIQQAADESVAFQRTLWKQSTEETLKRLAEGGIEIVHPDKTAFQEAVKPMYDAVANTAVGKLAERIRLVGLPEQEVAE